jgi:hypothetical protein
MLPDFIELFCVLFRQLFKLVALPLGESEEDLRKGRYSSSKSYAIAAPKTPARKTPIAYKSS